MKLNIRSRASPDMQVLRMELTHQVRRGCRTPLNCMGHFHIWSNGNAGWFCSAYGRFSLPASS